MVSTQVWMMVEVKADQMACLKDTRMVQSTVHMKVAPRVIQRVVMKVDMMVVEWVEMLACTKVNLWVDCLVALKVLLWVQRLVVELGKQRDNL